MLGSFHAANLLVLLPSWAQAAAHAIRIFQLEYRDS